MTSNRRKIRATGVTAVSVVAVLVLLCTARSVSASPLTRVGEFFFDFPGDPSEPVVHLSNEGLQAFAAFTITFESELVDVDGTTSLDVRPIPSAAPLEPGESFQIFAFDLTPPGAVLTPLTATLSQLVLALPGIISFSYDGGGTFVANPLLDFATVDSSIGIFFEAADPSDHSPVPEPTTLMLVAAGAAITGLRRVRRNIPNAISRLRNARDNS